MACKNPVLTDIVAKQSEIEAALNESFGTIDVKTDFKANIKNIKTEIEKSKLEKIKLQKDIKKAKTPIETKTIRDRLDDLPIKIIGLQKDLEILKKQEKAEPKRVAAMLSIYKRLDDNLQDLSKSRAGYINPFEVLETLKRFLAKRNFIFNSLNNLDLSELWSIDGLLKDLFAFQKRGVPIGKGRFSKSQFANEFLDPVIATIWYDKTFSAANVIFKSQEIADYREATINHFIDKHQVLIDRLKETHENFYTSKGEYFGDQELLKLTNKSTYQSEMSESLSYENLVAFVNNMASGEYRYFTADFIDTKYNKEVKSIVDKAINNQYNMYGTASEQALGPEISYVDLDKDVMIGKVNYGNRVYYTTVHKKIKQDGETKIVHYTQPVAAEKAVYKGREIYRLLYTSKGNAKKISMYINSALEAGFKDKIPDGFYGAREEVIHRGIRKSKKGKAEQISEAAYGQWKPLEDNAIPTKLLSRNERGFIKTQDGKPVHITLWTMLNKQSELLEQIYDTALKMNSENNMSLKSGLAQIKNAFIRGTGTDVGYKEILDELNNISGVKLGLRADKNNIYSTNPNIGKVLRNYFPVQYALNVSIAENINAIQGLERTLERDKAELDVLEIDYATTNDPETYGKINFLVNKIDKDEKSHEVLSAKLKSVLGLVSTREYNDISLDKIIRANKHRSNHMNRLRRRRDPDVFNDYVKTFFNDLYSNKLMSDMAPHLSKLWDRPDLVRYLLDHVRASLGHADTQASLFGIDYSNQRAADIKNANPFSKEHYTPESIYQGHLQITGALSGQFLRTPAALMNNTQRVNTIIANGLKSFTRSWKWMRDPVKRKIAEEAAKRAGITDVLVSVSDVFSSGFDPDRAQMKDGFLPIAQVATLKAGIKAFRKNKWYRKIFDIAIKKRRTTLKKKELIEQVDALMDGTWEVLNGVSKGTLSKKELELLMDKFKGVLEQSYIDKFVNYALYYMPMMKKWTTFTGVEMEMRTETLIGYALDAVDNGVAVNEASLTDLELKAWRDKHPHAVLEPAVLQVARQGVYNNMFGMSQNFLPKVFRGYGKLLLQYKTYPWAETMNEFIIIKNYLNMVKGRPNPADFKLNNLKDFNTGKVPATLLRLLITRGAITAWNMGWYYVPFYKTIGSSIKLGVNTTLSKTPINWRFSYSVQRGMESPPLKAILALLAIIFKAANIRDMEDEEEQRNLDELYYFFVPPMISIMHDIASSFYKGGLKEGLESSQRYVPGLSDPITQGVVKSAGYLLKGEEESYKVYD
jgi:hypothetical protein